MARDDREVAGISIVHTEVEQADVALAARGEADARADIARHPAASNDNAGASRGWRMPKLMDRALAARIHGGEVPTCEVLGMDEASILLGAGVTSQSIVVHLKLFNSRLEVQEKNLAPIKRLRTDLPGYAAWLDRMREVPLATDAAEAFLAIVRGERQQRQRVELATEARVYLKDLHLEWNEHQKMLLSADEAGLTADDVEQAYKDAAGGRDFDRELEPAPHATKPKHSVEAGRAPWSLDEELAEGVIRGGGGPQIPRPGAALAIDTKLRAEVLKGAGTLEALVGHAAPLGIVATSAISARLVDYRGQLDRKSLCVLVVGDNGAGKITFLNAILGTRILGDVASEPAETVTFIHQAPRATYRAKIRGGSIEEFQNIEADRRVQLAAAIAGHRQQLGNDADRLAKRSFHSDTSAALARVTAELGEAARACDGARAANADFEVRHAGWAAHMQHHTVERDAAQTRLSETERRLTLARAQMDGAQLLLSAAGSELREHTQRNRLGGPEEGLARVDATASVRLQATAARLADLIGKLPFFMRPAPWWAVWVFLLRLTIGWLFRARMRLVSEARVANRHAELIGANDDATARVEHVAGELVNATTHSQDAQRTVAKALDCIREAAASLALAARQLSESRAMLTQCERAQIVSQLNVSYAECDVLEQSSIARFRSEISDLTDAARRGRDVLELTIGFPSAQLPEGITLIDAPGVSSQSVSRRERAWELVRRDADACLLVSDLQQGVPAWARSFFHELRPIIPHVLLVLSKVDLTHGNNQNRGDDETWVQIENGRREAVRRFAGELGRPSREILSVAVFAEAALGRDPASQAFVDHFRVELIKLFDLVRLERAIILASYTTTALRDSIQQLAKARASAEAELLERVAVLERQRIADPRGFESRQLAKVDEALHAYAASIGQRARTLMSSGVDRVQERWVKTINACVTKDDVKATVVLLGQQGQEAMAGVMYEVDQAAAGWLRQAIKALEVPLLEELQARYLVVSQIAASGGDTTAYLTRAKKSGAVTQAANIKVGMSNAVADFEFGQFAIGAGGALAGAAIGTMVNPGIGTAIGAAIGALAGFFKTVESLKSDCVKGVCSGLDEAKRGLGLQLKPVDAQMQLRIQEVLTGELSGAVARFQSWSQQIIAAEQGRIVHERKKLSGLTRFRDALVQHDQALATLQREAASVSRSLCA